LEAVVKAVLALGSNGRGKGGVRGYMLALASQYPERFAPLLEKALQREHSAWSGEQAVLTDEQLMARIEKMSVDEIVVEHVIHLVVPPLPDPPSSAIDLLEAIIDAAKRHGSNGRGKDGVAGYIRMLAEIECKTFDKWIIRAMLEQVQGRSRQSIEETKARLAERGVEKTVYNLAFVMKHGVLPPENGTQKVAQQLLEDLQLAHQFIRESGEAKPAGAAPDGHDHDESWDI
jgi:hypothetical protein